MVVIGAGLHPSLLDELHLCCLTDDEMALGTDGWLDFEDPFPAWRIALDDADDTVVDDADRP